jgi:hypothetical protein
MTQVVDDEPAIPGRSGGEYRAYLQFDARPESRSSMVHQLAGWFLEHGLEPSFDRSGIYTSRDRELALLVRDPGTGTEISATLNEQSPVGIWKSEIILHIPASGLGWCVIDVSNSEARFVKVPRLARYILEVERCVDGEGMLSAQPAIVGPSRVPEVIDIVCDPERRGLVFVAGSTTEQDLDRFARRVGQWTKATRGLAQVIVLDPQATTDFNQEIGLDHAAPIGLLRTYLPGADPASRVDARRHKVLGTRRLQEQSPNEIERMLGLIARSQAGSVALPAPVITLRRSFIRLRDSIVVSGSAAPRSASMDTKAPGVSKPRPAPRYVPTAPQFIEDDDEDDTASGNAVRIVKAELEQRQARIEVLEDEVAQLQGQYEEEQLEHAVVEEERGDLADENRWLRRRLRELADFEAAAALVPAEARTSYPESFEDLLDRWDDAELPGVEFTGDGTKAIALDRVDTLETAVRAAWDALLVLADYLRARSERACQEGVHGYLRHTPDGFRQMSHSRHAPNESRATMEAWGGQRVFPVPADVEITRRATMEAHFRLGSLGMVSPRLYYVDRWTTNRRIYVGYIGRHLRNTKTN